MVSGLRIHCFAQLWIDWPQGWNTMLHSQPNVGFLPKNDLTNNFFIKLPVTWVSWVKIPTKCIFYFKKSDSDHLDLRGATRIITIWIFESLCFPKLGLIFADFIYILKWTQVQSKMYYITSISLAKICIILLAVQHCALKLSEVTLRLSVSNTYS